MPETTRDQGWLSVLYIEMPSATEGKNSEFPQVTAKNPKSKQAQTK